MAEEASHAQFILAKGGETMQEERVLRGNQRKQPRCKVLIIDNNEPIVAFLTLGLRYEGFQVEAEPNGSQGLRAAHYYQPDLVLLDLMLPDMDGLEVCHRLRSSPSTQSSLILVLTAKDTVQDRVAGLEAGADDYLTIPFSFEELLARVHALLRRTSASTQGSR
jgi:DNA-binding response OmpR family regulator